MASVPRWRPLLAHLSTVRALPASRRRALGERPEHRPAAGGRPAPERRLLAALLRPCVGLCSRYRPLSDAVLIAGS